MKAKVSLYPDIDKSVKAETSETLTKRDKLGHIQPISFSFRNRTQNPDYVAGLVSLAKVRQLQEQQPYYPIEPCARDPLRACLLHHNAEKKGGLFRDDILIKTTPKWFTRLNCSGYDPETGELVEVMYETNDLKASNNRKIKTLNAFCDYFQPLYSKRKVTLFIHTFTQADFAYLSMRRMLDIVKYRYKSIKREIRGYFWSLEISTPETDKIGFHVHYHLVVAVDRINVRGKKIPDELKMDEVWGQSTNVQIVKKNIRSYLSGYFAKNNWRMTYPDGSVFRMYGSSRKYL